MEMEKETYNSLVGKIEILNKIIINLQMMTVYIATPNEYTDKLLELTSQFVLLDTKSIYKN